MAMMILNIEIVLIDHFLREKWWSIEFFLLLL